MGTIKKLLKGYLLSVVLFMILTIGAALLLKFTALPESTNEICLIVAMSASCLFLGLFVGNLFGKRGILYGLFFSAILMFIIFFLTLLSFSAQFTWDILNWKYAIPILFGAIGGITGANLKH